MKATSVPIVNIISITIILGVREMKYMYIVDYEDGFTLKEKVNEWINENEENILEIIDIEYNQEGNLYFAIVSYLERGKE